MHNYFNSNTQFNNFSPNNNAEILLTPINLASFTQKTVNMRSVIFTTLVRHSARFIKSIFQDATEIHKMGSFYINFNNQILIMLTSPFNTMPEHDRNDLTNYIHHHFSCMKCILCPDIINVYATIKNKPYVTAVDEIYEYIVRNTELFPQSQEGSSILVQEKFPIAMSLPTPIDDVFKWYGPQFITIYTYHNKHGNPIGFNISYTNIQNEEISMFYTLWRERNSQKLHFLPKGPEPLYMVYNIQNVSHHKDIYVLFDESMVEDALMGNVPNVISIPFGLHNIDQVDFQSFEGKKLIFPYRQNFYEVNFLIRIQGLAKKHQTDIVFTGEIVHTVDQEQQLVSLVELLQRRNILLNSEQESINEASTGFSEIGSSVKNHDRVREIILAPIIQSGTITWLFAKEKVGKTLVALTIAYIVSKGHRNLGSWKSEEPKRVLYVDGEMAGDYITKYYMKIAEGYGDDPSPELPFATYLFANERLDYDSILDEEWLEIHKEKLFAYDLVILDNYYSLNENRVNVKPFLKLLKEMTARNVTIIVVDHTNREDDLQGSDIKRRAAELGIRLDACKENIIDISFSFDRHGLGTNDASQRLEKVFTSSTFRLLPIHEQEMEQAVPTELTNKDWKLLYSYILHTEHNFKQIKIAEITGLSSSTISNYISSVDKQLQGEAVERDTISHLELFQKELERVKGLSQNEVLGILETYKK